MSPSQQQNQPQFQEGKTYVSARPDIAQTLKNEEGNYRVTGFIAPVFNAHCLEGHSLVSLIPAGQEVGWIIRKLDSNTTALDADQPSGGSQRHMNRRSTDR